MTSPVDRRADAATTSDALLGDVSLDVEWKDIAGLERVRPILPSGTRIYVGFLDSEDMAMRVGTARAIRQSGFVPVPVIAARRLESEGMLREYLTGLREAGWSGRVLVVGGDPERPRGPYRDAGSVIGSGILEEHGVHEVSVAGYPGGHPVIADGVLWRALADNVAALDRRGLRGGIVTQFGFDAARVLAWLADVRALGIRLPVEVGVPGPASVRMLLRLASRCGVAVSAPAAREYGFSLADPAGEAGPGRFVRALAADYDPGLHGVVKLHFNTFSGIVTTVNWISQFRAERLR